MIRTQPDFDERCTLVFEYILLSLINLLSFSSLVCNKLLRSQALLSRGLSVDAVADLESVYCLVLEATLDLYRPSLGAKGSRK